MFKRGNFDLEELIPKDEFNFHGEEGWLLLDERLVVTNQYLRDKFGPITINNWHKGGDRSLSGYRPINCQTGAKRSYHKRGQAVDQIYHNESAAYVRDYILTHQAEFPYVTFMEDYPGMSWVHLGFNLTERTLDASKPIIVWSPYD